MKEADDCYVVNLTNVNVVPEYRFVKMQSLFLLSGLLK